MKQFIIKIPEGTRFFDLSEEIQNAIKAVNGQFPKGVVVGSQAVLGYELKLVLADSTAAQLEDQFLSLGLDWAVLAEEGVTGDETQILLYMLDKNILDADGEIISTEALTDLSSLQTYAGKSWTF